jgi:hypothetical protein
LNRADCCQEKAYGLKVFAGSNYCGEFPAGQKGWARIDCVGNLNASNIKII